MNAPLMICRLSGLRSVSHSSPSASGDSLLNNTSYNRTWDREAIRTDSKDQVKEWQVMRLWVDCVDRVAGTHASLKAGPGSVMGACCDCTHQVATGMPSASAIRVAGGIGALKCRSIGRIRV